MYFYYQVLIMGNNTDNFYCVVSLKVTEPLIMLTMVFFVICNPGLPGVGAAVQSVQSAAEQGLSAAMMKMQVCVGVRLANTVQFSVDEDRYIAFNVM